MTKVALITGVTGQDGPYLTRILLEKNYQVNALRQPNALPDTLHIEKLLPHIDLHYGDMTDGTSLQRIINHVKPDEIYNLAAQSHVKISFDTPEYTAQVNGLGVTRILEIIRNFHPHTKFFQASTSELFGDTQAPQNEKSAMNPRSPYAAAKKYAYDMVRVYREAYGIFACNGIMFNHESENRGEEFVTRKIVVAVANIIKGKQDCLELGNLDAKRDWSHAKDIMRGAWMIMQQNQADDFVLASGTSYRVRDFAEEAFRVAGMDITWDGEGMYETGRDKNGRVVVSVNPEFFRPLEVEDLQGDFSNARQKMGWKPEINFEAIVREMVEAELGYSTLDNVRKLHA